MKAFFQHHLVLNSLAMVGVLVLLGSALGVLLHGLPFEKSPQAPPTFTSTAKQLSLLAHPSQPSLPSSSSSPATPAPTIPDYTLPQAKDGMAPVIYRIPTELPVVYLGIDDGANKTQQEIDLLAQNNIKATLFLSDLFIATHHDFFKPIIAQGSMVEDHTLHHNTKMENEPYDYQKQEICGMADHIQQYYGRRPTLFRPPGGAYSDTMRRAAYDCGMKAVVTWIAKANGGSMQYQVGDRLRPGDIVLMHFRPEFAQDLQAFVTAMKASGLHTELLEDLSGAQ
jgi:peptidoglycan/xylan/chitin deacetylase (PgdA/CDA1 family)